MALTNEQIEKLEMRAKGILPESDAQELDQQLEESSELQKEANEHIDLYFALKALSLKPALQKIHEDLAAEGAFDGDPGNSESDVKVVPLKQPLQINWGWLIAASVFLCVFGIGILNFNHQRNDRLYARYASTLSEAYTADANTLGGFTQKGKEVFYYENFRKGVSLLQHNQPDKAIPLLKAASQSSNPKIQEDSEWFLTLAYLKNHDRSSAKKYATKIAGSTGHRFNDNAKHLQSDL
ncbi:hypothetical protein GCM10028806_35070 [Spirosoma terrae]|uniref:Tetratricopeptide repeat protein n=1 Tax=Spirosoma terrae TaxID=1968276 RepID=A0A6L9LDU5_9BACT|nr:hypothetical protein [Spirosoma terrae]NDU97542.1 hypothetical protein [Spirosoma terrae]